MRFQVPQFIEVEDKIFGPLTLRQFIYIVGGAGLLFLLWTFLPFYLTVLFGIPVIGISAGLAFYKVNERPFINVLESGFAYLLNTRLYLWKKQDKEIKREQPQDPKEKEALLKVPTLSESKLKDLAWSLDIKESIYSDKTQSKSDTIG